MNSEVVMKVPAIILSVFALIAVTIGVAAQKPAKPTVEVFKSPTCGCCSKWVDHVKAAGYTTKVTDLGDAELDRLKAKQGIPRTAMSCHTALVGGYTIEGHVPVAQIDRLLAEKPAVKGIAVGGMPLGSPGMEVPSGQVQPYNVVSFDQSGAVKVFAAIK